MAILYVSQTDGNDTRTYAQAQVRTTPIKTIARLRAIMLAGDAAQFDWRDTWPTNSASNEWLSGFPAGLSSTSKTRFTAMDGGVLGRPHFVRADGVENVAWVTGSNWGFENLDMTHGDAATKTSTGDHIVASDSGASIINVDFLGCRIGNTRNCAVRSFKGPLPHDTAGGGTHAGVGDDSGWRFLGCELYRANNNLLLHYGSSLKIDDWIRPADNKRVRSSLHWWGDSTAISAGKHAIYGECRSAVVKADFYNNEADAPWQGNACSQRGSGWDIYRCTFHDCNPWGVFWYDDVHGKTRFHDNAGLDCYGWVFFFNAHTDTGPDYTWPAGGNPVDDFVIVKNTMDLKGQNVSPGTAECNAWIDLSDASAAKVGVVEVANNVFTGNALRGVDVGTHTFTANNGVTGTIHEHNNRWLRDGGAVAFRHNSTAYASLAAWQAA